MMTKRTALTLASALEYSEQIANRRHVTFSTVVAEALEDGLANVRRARRADEVLTQYQRAFSGFTEEERAVLDGIDWESDNG